MANFGGTCPPKFSSAERRGIFHELWTLSFAKGGVNGSWERTFIQTNHGGAMRYRTQEIPEPTTELLFKGHNGWIWALALSPDGNTLAGGGSSYDPRIHLWNVRTSEVLGTLNGHKDSVTKLAFSPDGSTLYSTSFDRTLRAWNVARRTQDRVTLQNRNRMQTVAVAKDGTIATGGDDENLYVFPVGANEPLRFGLESIIYSLAFSQDCLTLAVGMWNGKVYIFQREDNSWRQSRKHTLNGDVCSLAFTPSGDRLLCGTSAGWVYCVDPNTDACERLGTLEPHLIGGIRPLLFTDDKTLLVGQWNTSVADGQQGSGRLAIFSWPDGRCLKSLNDLYGPTDSIVLLDNGRRLVTSKNRTPYLEKPDSYVPALLDFGDVNLGRGKLDETFINLPPGLII